MQAPFSDPVWENMLTFVQQMWKLREREDLLKGTGLQTVIQEGPSAIIQGLLFELAWV